MTIRERCLRGALERLREVIGAIEEYLPDLSEELGWLCENLVQELRSWNEEKSAFRALGEDA